MSTKKKATRKPKTPTTLYISLSKARRERLSGKLDKAGITQTQFFRAVIDAYLFPARQPTGKRAGLEIRVKEIA